MGAPGVTAIACGLALVGCGGAAVSEPGSSSHKTGDVLLSSHTTATEGSYVNGVSAEFFNGPGFYQPQGCERERMGECSLVRCDSTTASPPVLPGQPVSA